MSTARRISIPVHRRLAGTSTFRAPAQDALDTDASDEPAPSHRYKIGQRLNLAPDSRYFQRVACVCVVTATVPNESGPVHYRVRSESERFERVVSEFDLSPVENTP